MTDHAKAGTRVAKELRTYSKVFDVLKLIPGAEPWASLVKSVVDATGETTESIAEYRTPDVERQKHKLEEALRQFPRRVVVFVDDIDRLFPAEVFEMVRIIKSVGELPNVGYVVAWDPKYVVSALAAASIPQADTYLDKVVQVRLPLPAMSAQAKGVLVDEALRRLDPSALEAHFPGEEHRFSTLYWSGLRELLEHPRDVTRVFNTVSLIEPRLRGELAFAEIVGLAALMVKAPRVFDVLKREPRWFVGNLPVDPGVRKDKEVVQVGSVSLDAAMDGSDSPQAVRQLTNRLFPLTSEKGSYPDRSADTAGRIASPRRLLVALQLAISEGDVSYVAARRYIREPAARVEIAGTLTIQNCLEFLETVGDVADTLSGEALENVDLLCVEIARLVEVEPFPTRAKDRSKFFSIPADNVALRAIEMLVSATGKNSAADVARKIAKDPQSLTAAVEIFARSYLAPKDNYLVVCAPREKQAIGRSIAAHVTRAASTGALMRSAHPSFVLFRLPDIAPGACRRTFTAISAHDASLDTFIMHVMARSYDSNKGQVYELPKDLKQVECYVSLRTLRRHGQKRLADPTLTYPARAAWSALVTPAALYGLDGSPAR